MRILVSGASGFLGTAVVGALAAGGHDVRGLVRARAKAPVVTSAGGTPVVGDVLLPASLATAAAGCEAIVHLAQSFDEGPEHARAVRVEGARNLAAAARSSGVRRLVIGSGYWVYPGGPDRLDEESPVRPIGLSGWNFAAEAEGSAAAASGGLEAIAVRPGMVYGNGSWFREMAGELVDGTYRFVGDGSHRLSPVALPDAAEGFRAIVERGEAGRTYLVVDDLPVSHREFAAYVARELGAPSPRGLPFEEAVQQWGEDIARLNAADRAATNARLRSLGWKPRYPTYRDGLPSVLALLRGSVPVARPHDRPAGPPGAEPGRKKP